VHVSFRVTPRCRPNGRNVSFRKGGGEIRDEKIPLPDASADVSVGSSSPDLKVDIKRGGTHVNREGTLPVGIECDLSASP